MRALIARWRSIFASIPLRWRLALATFGLLAVLLSALGTVITLTEEHTLLQSQAATLYDEIGLAVPGNGGVPGNGDMEVSIATPAMQPPPPAHLPPPPVNFHLQTMVRRLTSDSVRASVFSPQGDILVTDISGVVVPPPLVIPGQDDVQRILQQVPDTNSYALVAVSGQRQLVVMMPLVATGATVGILVVSTPTATIDQSVVLTRFILLLGTLVALLLAAAFILPLVGATLRPLVQMQRTSALIAAGDLELRLDVPPSKDEIGQLAVAFNHMVAQLEAAFQRQERFVADASHELRTPLTVLRGGMEMLLIGADEGDVESARRLVRGMFGETQRMQRLVDDLLTLTRLDEHRVGLRMESLDVAALLRDVATETEQLAHGQTIMVEIAPDVPPISADADRLKQVLLNLISNAIKFTPANGTIRLGAGRATTGEVQLIVADTGVGMDAATLPHIFERFYRVDSARTRTAPQFGGSGLGLAIVKGLIEAQGGTITIASELDHGTTATIMFPVS